MEFYSQRESSPLVAVVRVPCPKEQPLLECPTKDRCGSLVPGVKINAPGALPSLYFPRLTSRSNVRNLPEKPKHVRENKQKFRLTHWTVSYSRIQTERGNLESQTSKMKFQRRQPSFKSVCLCTHCQTSSILSKRGTKTHHGRMMSVRKVTPSGYHERQL